MSRYSSYDGSVADHYITPVNSIISRHMSDIRPNDIHYMRKNLRDLISRHNDNLFDFVRPDTAMPEGFANVIRSKLGAESSPFGKSITAGIGALKLDCSMNTVVDELNEKYASAVGCSGEASQLDGFVAGFKWILEEYKAAGEAVFRAQDTLNQKLGQLNTTIQKAELITKLPENEALQGIYDAFTEYINIAFTDAKLEESYKDLIENYKRWTYLYDIVSAQQLFTGREDEHTCSICVANSITHTVSPCGHTFCSICIMKMNTACYICRGPIRDRIRLYFN